MDRAAIRTLYLDALDSATQRPVTGDPDAALHAFLTLNAGYFLGEWLSEEVHAALVQRLASALDGITDLPLPEDAAHAAQLAQHVREIEDAFGPRPWTTVLIRRTALLIPTRKEDWDALALAATEAIATGGDGHALLLAHARRRLWELAHPDRTATGDTPAMAPPPALAHAALEADGHIIQVLEAALAEMSIPPLRSALVSLRHPATWTAGMVRYL